MNMFQRRKAKLQEALGAAKAARTGGKITPVKKDKKYEKK